MVERTVFIGLLVSGFAPCILIILISLVTGRWQWLLRGKARGSDDPSAVLRFLGRLQVWLFPLYLILLVFFAGLSLR